MNSWEREKGAVARVHARLVAQGVVAPVALGGQDELRWSDCDLASLAENRLGDRADPRTLDEARRRDWLARATTEGRWWQPSERTYEVCYWLLEDGARIGTIALASSSLGNTLLNIASFYLFPSERGRGAGSRALTKVREALAEDGFGMRLDTSWCWQHAVHFYVRLGMWVHMWKRQLCFRWSSGEPPPRLEVHGDEANLSVELAGRRTTLRRARRDGDRLVWVDVATEHEDEALASLAWQADSSFALGLALHGWPLVRSAEQWEQCHWADAGPPEALAYKITVWEAFDRHKGWRVATPRIPALDYPSWEQYQARWQAEIDAL